MVAVQAARPTTACTQAVGRNRQQACDRLLHFTPAEHCRGRRAQRGDSRMIRRLLLALACASIMGLMSSASEAQAQERAYGRVWGGQNSRMDWDRFYHYPYVYYPQNFWGNEYYRSSQDLYFRYPQEMRIPVYNRQWHNEYPEERRYHQGHQFMLDVF